MKKTIIFSETLLFTLILLFSFTNVNAQRGMNRPKVGGWGGGSRYTRLYDTNTVETITATVLAVERITQTKGMSPGVHLTVKTDQETISVHLGPAWFIENQDVAIEQDDELEIKGSRIEFDGNPAIIAAKVEKNERTLILRDEYGFPVWSGWRRK